MASKVAKTLPRSSAFKKFLQLIDVEHSLFGLPFAYLGAFLATMGWPGFGKLWWITVAMVSARTAALCLNRLIDRHLDRANPRTRHWIMAQNQFPAPAIWVLSWLMFLILFWAAAHLNPLCFYLAPLAVAILTGYSYTKRFTWCCHLILGMAVGMGPVGGWFAVTGTFSLIPVILGAAVAGWVGGFDVIYACQDIVFDRAHGLYSIPARFGTRGALRLAALFHIGTICFLALTGLILQLGPWYYAGLGVTAGILVYEHSLVSEFDLSRVYQASFRINHYVSSIIFVFTLLDIWL
jgi:4-hydroxybenzoate polyprenyltransferase